MLGFANVVFHEGIGFAHVHLVIEHLCVLDGVQEFGQLEGPLLAPEDLVRQDDVFEVEERLGKTLLALGRLREDEQTELGCHVEPLKVVLENVGHNDLV